MKFLSLLVVLILAADFSSAATLTVTSDADSGAGSLRDTLASASAGDTINFSGTRNIALSTGISSSLANIDIDGTGATVTITDSTNALACLTLTGADVTLSDLSITGCGAAVTFGNGATVDNVIIQSSTTAGILLTPSSNSYAINNVNIDTSGNGIGTVATATGTITISLTGSTLSNNGQYGVDFLSLSNTITGTISGNTINSNQLDGIRVGSGSSLTIANNAIQLNLDDGVSNLGGCSTCTYSGNTILNNGADGVVFLAGNTPNLVMTSNTISSNTDNGISVRHTATTTGIIGDTTTTTNGNTITNNGGFGIQVTGATPVGLQILLNSISGNTLGGIDNPGTNSNPQTTSTPQNTPTINSATVDTFVNTITVAGSLTTGTAYANAAFRFDIYCSGNTENQGSVWLFSFTANANGQGSVTGFSRSNAFTSGSCTIGTDDVVVTATNTQGQTSEFSSRVLLVQGASTSLTPSTSPTRSFSSSPSASPSITPTISTTPSISATPTITPSISVTSSITPSTSLSVSLTPTTSTTRSPSISLSESSSISPSVSVSNSVAPSASSTVTPSLSESNSVAASATSSVTPSVSDSQTPAPSATSSTSLSESNSASTSLSPTGSVSLSESSSATISITPSLTPSVTPSLSATPTITPSISNSPTNTPSISDSPSFTPSISFSPSVTPVVCGDGQVSGPEECDFGQRPIDFWRAQCCNIDSCQFRRPGVVCDTSATRNDCFTKRRCAGGPLVGVCRSPVPRPGRRCGVNSAGVCLSDGVCQLQ